MKRINKHIVSVAVAAALGAPMAAMATNGILPLGNGMVAHGMGGAGIANGSEAMSGVDNPALVSRTSNQWAVGASLFMPYRSADFGSGYVESDSNYFIIPQGGVTFGLAKDWDMGILVTAMGGMNTDYPSTGINPASSGQTGMNLSGLLVSVPFSFKFGGSHSIAIAPVLGYEKMKTEFGPGVFGPTTPQGGSDSATGYGFQLGYVGDLGKDWTIGLTYQSKISMGEMSNFCDAVPSGIFNGLKQNGKDCSLDMPDQYGIGLQWRVSDAWKVVGDIKQVNWSSVDVFGEHIPLGGGNYAGFGWEDQTLYKIGAEFKSSDTMAWRFGYNYGATPIPDENIGTNLLAPAVTTSHFTFGIGAKVGSGEINGYFAYVPENEQVAPAGLPKAKMNQYALGVGWNASF